MAKVVKPFARMRKFKVTNGTHVQGGRVYSAGDIIESREDLAATWQNKFEEIAQPEVRYATAAEEEEDGGEGTYTPEGKDVTASFPKAVEEDFKVFRRKVDDKFKYFVYDADDLTAPRNKEGVDKADVDQVIADSLV